MRRYDAVIFDMDGTVLDTLTDLTQSVNKILRKYGYNERSAKEVRGYLGDGVVALIERSIGEEVPKKRFDEILDEYREIYAAHLNDNTRPYPGILSLLAELRKSGVKTAVLSNKSDAPVKALARRHFSDLFDAAAGGREGIRLKPAPDGLFEVMKELGVSPENTLYAGDSEVDVKTARNAGTDVVWVSWGYREPDALADDPPDYIAHTANEVAAIALDTE